jgi:hypothetical protein
MSLQTFFVGGLRFRLRKASRLRKAYGGQDGGTSRRSREDEEKMNGCEARGGCGAG